MVAVMMYHTETGTRQQMTNWLPDAEETKLNQEAERLQKVAAHHSDEVFFVTHDTDLQNR